MFSFRKKQKNNELLEMFEKTTDDLHDVFNQCENLIKNNQLPITEFLETTAVEFSNNLARKQFEPWLYRSAVAYMYCCHLLLKPNVVFETGVERGSSTYVALKGFSKSGNSDAVLYSFDTTPEIHVKLGLGIAPVVPRDFYNKMKNQHKHYNGMSVDNIPNALKTLEGKIDIIFIGSDHRYENQKTETELLWPFLRSGGIAFIDRPDIEGNNYRAWNEFLNNFKIRWNTLLPESKFNLPYKIGVLIKDD